jgi:hypothetical protein
MVTGMRVLGILRRNRPTLVDLTQRAIDQAPDDDRDWLAALDVELDVQNLEWAMASEDPAA